MTRQDIDRAALIVQQIAGVGDGAMDYGIVEFGFGENGISGGWWLDGGIHGLVEAIDSLEVWIPTDATASLNACRLAVMCAVDERRAELERMVAHGHDGTYSVLLAHLEMSDGTTLETVTA